MRSRELAEVRTPNGPMLQVTRVIPEGPAANAGLVAGDVIWAINGQTVLDSSFASREIAAAKPGARIALELRRGRRRSMSE